MDNAEARSKVSFEWLRALADLRDVNKRAELLHSVDPELLEEALIPHVKNLGMNDIVASLPPTPLLFRRCGDGREAKRDDRRSHRRTRFRRALRSRRRFDAVYHPRGMGADGLRISFQLSAFSPIHPPPSTRPSTGPVPTADGVGQTNY